MMVRLAEAAICTSLAHPGTKACDAGGGAFSPEWRDGPVTTGSSNINTVSCDPPVPGVGKKNWRWVWDKSRERCCLIDTGREELVLHEQFVVLYRCIGRYFPPLSCTQHVPSGYL